MKLKPTLKQKMVIALVLAGVVIWTGNKFLSPGKDQTTYESATAVRGALIKTISGSGSITSGNRTDVTTKVSGVVSRVYVTNGDSVTKGQKIAEVTPDDRAKERQAAAWVAYLDATTAVKEAANTKALTDINMWRARQDVLDAQEDVDSLDDHTYTDGEKMIITKTLDQSRLAFEAAESKYLNADAGTAYARAKAAAALLDYRENSATIVAPQAGIVSDLALAEGLLVSASSTTSNTSGATIVSARTVGKISHPEGRLTATVSLSEVDIIDVKANQKASLTLDAYPEKTFTGKVLSVDTSGSSSSNVTSYQVIILLDPVKAEIYTNMAINAEIITNIENDVVMVPSTAITTVNNQPAVKVLKDGQVSVKEVETGDSNDTQTVIVSGIEEGETVVTAEINPETSGQSSSGTTSPFGSFGRTGTGSTTRGSGVMIQGGPGGF